MIYIGIDPGVSGGLAAIGNQVFAITSMPPTEVDIWEWFSCSFGRLACPDFAVIEKNSGYVGGNGNPGSAMYKFGRNAGLLAMALTASGIPYEEVTPGVWQRGLGIPCRKKDEPKGRFKNRLKAHSQKLFPLEHITLSTADAVLIAEYCRRKQEGKL